VSRSGKLRELAKTIRGLQRLRTRRGVEAAQRTLDAIVLTPPVGLRWCWRCGTAHVVPA
jgi:hypothetical protein